MTRREALKRTAAITGIAVTSSAGIGILEGCTPTGDPGWQPKFLKKDEVSCISSIAETLLPKTETPGALDIHVPEFIDLMLADNYSLKDQKAFQTDLENFQQKAWRRFNRGFEKCSEGDKTILLTEEEDQSMDIYHKTYQKSFYLIIKELTLLGYFTSEYVMTNMLDYHPVPGKYEGCVPFTINGKVYVDNNVGPS